MNNKEHNKSNEAKEPPVAHGFVHRSEDEKLLADALRPDMEKLRLFTKMLRRNAMLNKVDIQHKDQ